MSLYRETTPARVYLGDTLASSVYEGDVEIWRRDPSYVDVSTSTSLVVPSWAALVDVGVLGGGGGGATADNGASTSNGAGGSPGVWVTATRAVTPGDVLTFTIGNGGTGGSGGVKRSGTAGGSTTVSGAVSLTSPGGAPGLGSATNDDTTGRGAAPATLGTATFPGSADVGASTPGSIPGGAGGGGPYPGWFGSPAAAGPGARGAARVRFRSY